VNVVGRTIEQDRLRQLVNRAVASQGGAMVISGPAGVGKTALLEWLHGEWVQGVADEANLDVRRVTGNPIRQRRPYDALQALLLTNSEERKAVAADPVLATVCGLVTQASPPQGIVVGSALLSHLSARAEARPIVLLIDDLAWIDTSSASALLFVARRLVADRVAMVFGVDSNALALAGRTPRADTESDVRGLDRIELSVLKDSPQPNLQKLYVEQIDSLSLAAQKLCSAAAIDDDYQLLASYMQSQDSEIDAALDEACSAGLLLRGVGTEQRLRFCHPLMGSSALSAISPAQARKLHTSFAELLQASLLSDRSRDRARPKSPKRLAGASSRNSVAVPNLSPLSDSPWSGEVGGNAVADRIALHRADGALGTDDQAAELLTKFAQRAQQRGATSEACWALLRAAELTTDGALRDWWVVEAAQLFHNSGRAVDALALIEPLAARHSGAASEVSSVFTSDTASEAPSAALSAAPSPSGDRSSELGSSGKMDVRLQLKLSTLLANASQWERDPQTLVRKVRGEIGDLPIRQPSQAAWTYVYLANLAYLAGDIATGIADADQAIALADATGDYFAGMAGRGNLQWNLFLHADHSRKVYDQPDVATILAVVAASETVEGVVAGQGMAMIAIMEERWELADQILPEMAAAARRRGLHSAAVLYDGLIASLHWRRGQWSEAWCLAIDSLNDGERPTVSLAWARAAAAVMAASMGDDERTSQLAGQALSVAHALRVPMIAAWAHSALGQLELSRGRPELALPHCQQVAAIMKATGIREPCFLFWHGDWIDVLVETGRWAEAEAAIAELEELSRITGRSWARGIGWQTHRVSPKHSLPPLLTNLRHLACRSKRPEPTSPELCHKSAAFLPLPGAC
jgi:tetratricopeptide (TPR) repeat protein